MNDYLGWKIEYWRDFGYLAKKNGQRIQGDTQLDLIRRINDRENQ
jgi:hypothetical protein